MESGTELMVRIILHPERSKGAIASLLVAVVAATSIWAAYWVWHRHHDDVALQRTILDLVLDWQCPDGHQFEAKGLYTTRACPICGKPARIIITYECPKHGIYRLPVIFDELTGKPTDVRYPSGEWLHISDTVPCPRCAGEMHPKQRSPFDKLRAKANRVEGRLAAPVLPHHRTYSPYPAVSSTVVTQHTVRSGTRVPDP